MSNWVLAAPPQPFVEVEGERARFPVHRIYCVGRNYADHAKEMGMDQKDPPFFFSKPADAVVPGGAPVPYPPRTANFHHEVELVVAIGTAGREIAANRALEYVYGYAVGIDWTRRDLQFALRDKGRPWDVSKGFDRSASIGALRPAARVGHVGRGRIWLSVNGETRQQGDVADMIWNVPDVIAELSTYVELQPGDLIYTGTPAGVGPVQAGDLVAAGIDSLGTIEHRIVAAGERA